MEGKSFPGVASSGLWVAAGAQTLQRTSEYSRMSGSTELNWMEGKFLVARRERSADGDRQRAGSAAYK